MDKKSIESVYKLSPLQQGILFHCLLAPEEPLYLEQTSWPVYLDLRVSLFERAWLEIIRRHTILRTAFIYEGLENPVQAVLRDVPFQVLLIDLRSLDAARQTKAVERFLTKRRYQKYDFNRPPLSRVALLQTGPVDFVLVWNFHHILMDGWSSSLVLKEVLGLYARYRVGTPFELTPTRPYRDYIGWLERQDLGMAENFWRQELAMFPGTTRLAIDRPQVVPPFSDRVGVVQKDAPLLAALSDFTRAHRLTVNTLIQAAWSLVLARYSGAQDVTHGAVASGRPAQLPGVESIAGLFINSLPIRAVIKPSETVLEFLARTQARFTQALRFEYSPSIKIREWADVQDGSPLFETLLAYENYPSNLVPPPPPEGGRTLGLQANTYTTRTHYPVDVMVVPVPKPFIRISFDRSRFERSEISTLLDRYLFCLEQLTRAPDQPMTQVSLLSAIERQGYLEDWNRTDAAFDSSTSIHQYLALWADRDPDAIAITWAEQPFTYAQLRDWSGQIARSLRRKGIGAESLVGISCRRSPALIAGVLGIMEAGAGYLPLDPGYPENRIAMMIEDAHPALILGEQGSGLNLPVGAPEWMAIEPLTRETSYPSMTQPLGDEVAYIIYTSGSTGRPKAVVVTHKNLRNLIQATLSVLKLERGSCVLQAATVNFDAFDWEVFAALTVGARLCLANDEEANSGAALQKLLETSEVSHVFMTPSSLALLPAADFPHLRVLAIGGEAYGQSLIDRFIEGRDFFNVYGPTETTIYALYHHCSKGEDRVYLGGPFANYRAYVLDRFATPCLPWVVGELYLGGQGLTRGYLNRPALTASRFVPDPFSTTAAAGGRLYKTGDLVRLVPLPGENHAALEFVGRTDFQVKLRGQRVELPEIEHHLSQHPAVLACAVIHRDFGMGDQRIFAFVQARVGTDPNVAALRAFLRDRLPAYQVPSHIALLATLPLSPTGKVDRKRLAALAEGAIEPEDDDYVAPATELELQVATIWAEVLKREKVGAQDNFFDLGGHSLLATQVMFRVQQQFGRDIPLKALFMGPTVAELATTIASFQKTETPDQGLAAVITPNPRQEVSEFPLSYAQLRLWFLDSMNPSQGARTAYNIPLALRLRGPLDIRALEQAFAELQRRHESLRTVIVQKDGEPVQRILPAPSGGFVTIDLTGHKRFVDPIAARHAAHLFDLARGPLFRVCLIRADADEHLLLCNQHHIISDGWSLDILTRELCALYQGYLLNRVVTLPQPDISYADYALWQRRTLDSDQLQAQAEYWRNQLDGLPKLIELPTDRPRPFHQTYRGESLPIAISEAVYAQLSKITEHHRVSLFMLLDAIYAILLANYSGQQDIAIGSPLANRDRVELASLIGFFVNTLVLRHRLAPDTKFTTYLEQVRDTALAAYAHGQFPFEKLVETLQPERSLSHSALFQVMMNWRTAASEPLRLVGIDAQLVRDAAISTKFDLTLNLTDTGTRLKGDLVFNRDLFDRQTMIRFVDQLEHLTASVAANPGRSLFEFEYMSERERKEIIGHANPAALPVETLSAVDLFRRWATRAPDATALELVEGEQVRSWGYGELDASSDQLAILLAKQGVREHTPVAVCLRDADRVLIGLLAVFKLGALLVPLEPNFPEERQKHILADANAALLLLQQGIPVAPGFTGTVLDLDAVALNGAGPLPQPNLFPEQPLYVIYTSGSTGKPKGVILPEHAFVAMVRSQIEAFGYETHSRVILSLTYAFDLGLIVRWCTLAAGGTLIAVPAHELGDPKVFARVLRHRAVNALHTTPVFLREMVMAGVDLSTLNVLRLGGESLNVALVAELRASTLPSCRFFNSYGPTEAGVSTSFHELVPGAERSERETIAIGRSLANHSLFICDPRGRLCAKGVYGELQIGRHLAQGYLGNPRLTATKFVPDPFSGDSGARLYRSGDLVRWLVNGQDDACLVFAGRIDRQIKLRGYRIEPGEIEAELARFPAVATAVVLLRETRPGDLQLVAYLCPKAGMELEPTQLPDYLEGILPAFMRPSAYIVLDGLPLTANGKLDVAALPLPNRSERLFAEPRTQLEHLLARTWADLLGLERVGRDDDFFRLGGHSLLLTRVISRLKASGLDLPLKLMFEYPVLGRLAEAIAATNRVLSIPAVSRANQKEYPLSYAQLRLWFLDTLAATHEAGTAYNMPVALALEGPLQALALEKAFAQLIARHESLRTRFLSTDADPVQIIDPPALFHLEVIDLGDRPEQTRALAMHEANHRFNLSRGPLFRVKLLRLNANRHLLLCNQHHIITDGWSISLITQDLCALYSAAIEEREAGLAPLNLGYPDYALWQRQNLQGPELEAQIAYWKHTLAGLPSLIELPTARPRPPVQSYAGDLLPLAISAPVYRGLAALAARTGASLFMVCEALLSILLARYSGQTDIALGTVTANRERAELANLVGFFVNTLVLRHRLPRFQSFEAYLAQVRETAIAAFAHGDFPFEKLVEALNPERSPGHSPLFQVMLNWQTHNSEPALLRGLVAHSYEPGTPVAKFDLTLGLVDQGDHLTGYLLFNRDLFDRERMGHFVRHFVTLATHVSTRPETGIAELDLFDAHERSQVLACWNPPRDTVQPQTLPRYFQSIVDQHPEATALISGEPGRMHCHSYAALNRAANQLAARLTRSGVCERTLLGVSLRDPHEVIVGLIGACKTGATLVLIDPALPEERRSFILADSGSQHLLTSPELSQPKRSCLLHFIEVGPEPEDQQPKLPVILPQQPLYVIYTSGSTGKPKGVVLPHHAFCSVMTAYQHFLRLDHHSVTLQTMSFAFDFGFLERWATLNVGGTLVSISPHLLADPNAIGKVMVDQSINTLQCTPAFIRELVGADVYLKGLKLLHVGGETVSTELIQELRRVTNPACQLVNGYGPTEAAVSTTMHVIDQIDETSGWDSVPIGPNLANHSMFVCDREGFLVPPGALGELRVGRHLAHCYHRRPGLTANAFVPDPYSGDAGARLYRTGDLVRARFDHGKPVLEFRGRIDRQVKLRGYRIEPGEVEAALACLDQVQHSAVFPWSFGGNQMLVACIQPHPGSSPDVTTIRRQLANRLPGYMIPSLIALVTSFPRTANGKLDLAELALAARGARTQDREYQAPKTASEKILAEIWTEVLGHERISAEADFFHLGGHSLLCTRVLAKLAQRGFSVPLGILFQHPILSRLAEAISIYRDTAEQPSTPNNPNQRDGDIQPIYGPELKSRRLEFPLSHAQLRLWFLDALNGPADAGTAYNLPQALFLSGPLHVAALEDSFRALIERHDSLRTRFTRNADEPVQLIEPIGPFALDVVALGNRPELARALAARDAQFRFNLETGPLFRSKLIRLSPDLHVLLLNQHHIITDGWSIRLMTNELCALYRAQALGRNPPEFEPIRISYGDYSAWQQTWIKSERFRNQINWWEANLVGLPSLLELPCDRVRPTHQSLRGQSVPIVLAASIRGRLAEIATQSRATLFTLCDALFSIILARYSGQDDLAIGIPTANRDRAELAPLIGFFVNTLVLRHRLDWRAGFLDYLDQVRESTRAAFAHGEIPFEKLVERLNPERNLSHAPLFQVSLNWETNSEEPLQLPDLKVQNLQTDAISAKFDLTLNLRDDGDQIRGWLVYNRDLFDHSSIERFGRAWETLAASVAAEPTQTLADLDFLDQASRRELLSYWNPPLDATYRLTAVDLIRRAARQFADKPALVIAASDQHRTLSYSELDQASDRLAARLQRHGAKACTPLGICLRDPLYATLGLLGAAKVGALLVPIDPNYPEERQYYMLAHTKAPLFLTEAGLHPSQAGFTGQWLSIEHELEAAPDLTLVAQILPEQPLYMIHTSGSTGQPKGVVITHGSFARMAEAYNDKLRYDANTIALQTMSYAFDFGFMERWCTLAAGGRLVLMPPRELADPSAFQGVLQAQQINGLQCTPSFIREMIASGVSLEGLKLLHVGGESVKTELIRQLRRTIGRGCLIINGYGPTETSVSSTMHEVLQADEDSDWDTVPIGSFLGNHCLFVCDRDGRPLPEGAAGELRVGRDLALGYWGRPGTTAAVFVPDNLSGDVGARLYRTGDLVRARNNQGVPPVLDFRGRIDRQVKLRGYRVEPGEIESVLARSEQIRQVAVFPWSYEGHIHLTACISLVEGGSIEAEAIQKRLGERLPEFMVPTVIVFVKQFPLTANGKLDLAALGQLATSQRALQGEDTYQVPSTDAESMLAEIWADVLGIQRVSANSNFFRLGGHSLLCTRVLTRLVNKGYAVPLRLLFEFPVLDQLAQALVSFDPEDLAATVATADTQATEFPLSHAQSRLWFLDGMATTADAATAYNLPIALYLDGPLHVGALELALGCLLERHKSLRTRFVERGDMAVQIIDPTTPYSLPLIDLGDRPDSARHLAEREAQYRFDLARGPLFRTLLVRLHARRHLFLCNQHHIITDGWSIGLITRELHALYDHAVSGLAQPDLPPLKLTYADYALWQQRFLGGKRLQTRIEFWRRSLEGLPSLIDLPTDRVRPRIKTYCGQVVPITLEPALRARLASLATRAGASLFMVCDALFSIMLARTSGQQDIAIGTPSANRERAELVPLVGFFVNTLVLRHRVTLHTPFLSYLEQVRQTALDAFANGDVPFEKLVEVLKPERSLGHTPIFQVSFNWQTLLEEPIRLKGLVSQPLVQDAITAKFDLSLGLTDNGESLRGSLVYNTDLFDRATIERFARFLTVLSTSAAAHPDTPIGELEFLDREDRRWLLAFWNPSAEAPCQATLPGYFRRAAQRYGSQTALVALDGEQERSFSYAQLDHESDQLAARLIQLGLRSQAPVGICLRDPYLVLVGLIGATKAGATLVLIDPICPYDRQALILADTGALLFLTEHGLHENERGFSGRWHYLDEVDAFAADAPLGEPIMLPEQALYIIYTSGTTGKPKGVVMPHQAFCRVMDDYFEKLGFGPETVALQTMSYAFDLGFNERWSTLAAGATLIALPAHQLTDPIWFGQVFQDYRVDALQGTPSFVREMIAAGVSFAGLKLLHVGGEAVKLDLVRQLRRQCGSALVFINSYGPTETAGSSTLHSMNEVDDGSAWDRVPIGRELANHALFVCDAKGRLVPPGALGELRVGRQLAFGYMQRPALTASLFVPDDLSGDSGARLFRSGDLVRARFDQGEPPVLAFLGRIDNQAKSAGDRIEPGEIGKLDHAALGQLAKSQAVVQDEDLSASREAESILAEIWADVLGVQRVSTHSHFFRLGGHSLLCTRVLTRLVGKGYAVPLRLLFEFPVLGQLAQALVAYDQEDMTATVALAGAQETDFPLSHAQSRLWFLDGMATTADAATAYNLPMALYLDGPLDLGALEHALARLLERHQSLRTRFVKRGDSAVQVIDPTTPYSLPLIDLGDRPDSARHLAEREAQFRFDLARGPLFRTMLVRLHARRHLFLCNQHHIITDGWSIGLITRELHTLYDQAVSDRAQPDLPPLKFAYADYALWQRRYLHGKRLLSRIEFWRRSLEGLPSLIDLPTDRVRPTVQTFRGQLVPITIEPALRARLASLATRAGASLFMVCDALFSIMLARTSGQQDIAIGTPSANRERAELVPLVGFFVNTLVLRHRVTPHTPFLSYLEQVRQTALDAFANGDVPFEKLVEVLKPERSLGHTPIFQVSFNWQTRLEEPILLKGLVSRPLVQDAITAKFDLSLGLTDNGESLRGSLVYNTDLFDRATIERFARFLTVLSTSAAAHPDTPIGELEFLDQEDRRWLLAFWNPSAEAPCQATLPGYFRRAAQRYGSQTALVALDGEHVRSFSYAQLDHESDQLAARLIQLGLRNQAPVGICLRDPYLVLVGLIGATKAGATLVLIDPIYPLDRQAFILKDTAALLFLTEHGLHENERGFSGRWHYLDEVDAFAADAPLGEPIILPEQALYIIYTSGSTGKPKGVVMPHQAFCRMMEEYFEKLGFGPETVALQTMSYAFDFGFIERWSTLAAGATLIALPAHQLTDPIRFGQVFQDYRVDALQGTPSFVREMIAAGVSFAGLKLLHVGGEAVMLDLVRQVRRQCGSALVFINGYGPTEATVSSTMHSINQVDERSVWDTVPIGRDLANHALFVCDANGRLVPPGTLGELRVGRLLAFGYLHRPALTASLFVPDDLSGDSGARLYRSGDLVRARFDHGEPPVLEFRGRMDRQVKLRGYRIEPGEIEAVLGTLEYVRQNAVFPWSFEGNRQLTACILTREGHQPELEQVQRDLGQRLPDYMVPGVIAFVEQFPLTPNGKLDLAALGRMAEAQWSSETVRVQYVAPRTQQECLLAEIWSEVLGVERISAQANFFKLGGHSLLCTRVVARLHKQGLGVPLHLVFEYPVLDQLAAKIATASQELEPLRRIDRSGLEQLEFPLSPAQQRLFFLNELSNTKAAATAYNMPLALYLEGPLHLVALERALDVLIERHESLRTRFVLIQGEAYQRISPARPCRLIVADLGADSEQVQHLIARHAAWIFNLSQGPLFRVVMLRIHQKRHVLMLNQHHIISDGWSVAIMTRELASLYRARVSGLEAPTLASMPITYADYAVWQRQSLAGQRLIACTDYWREQLAGLPTLLEFPTDRTRPTSPSFIGEAVPIRLHGALVTSLRQLAEQSGTTLFMLLDAVLSLMLARYSGQDDIAIGTPSANRDRPELASLIGFFVNTLVLRHRPQPRLTFLDYLEQVRRTALAAYAHGELPFEKLVETLQPERNFGISPLFQVMFSWQSAAEEPVSLPGLKAQPVQSGRTSAKFDLVLNLVESFERIQGSLVYNRDLFEHQSIARFAAQFEHLAGLIVAAPQERLDRFDLLTEQDRRFLLTQANPPCAEACTMAAPDWFRNQAARTPEANALIEVCGGQTQTWTYGELEVASDALAARLADLGVRLNTPVGIHLAEPRAVLVGLLAAAKLGALLVLIDPLNPKERQSFILADSRTEWVLTQQHLSRCEASATCRWLDLDQPVAMGRPPQHRILAQQPVYLIYTSGSTGRPKGVLLSQQAFAITVRTHIDEYRYRSESRVLLTLSYAFDFGLIVRWCTLASGGALIAMPPAELADPLAFEQVCRDQAVDTLHCTPSFLREMLGAGVQLFGLKLVHMGGEAVQAELITSLRTRISAACRILNGYGPTEAGISATLYDIEPDRELLGQEAVPIGRLIADHGLFVCDRAGRLSPPGVPGELWIGRQLASGYLDRPGLTAARFVPDPYSGDSGARLYKSGDLVRWRAEGPAEPVLVFMGRIDRQLKLRGYRIEPGEIEAQLARHPAVRVAVVSARRDEIGETMLVAYLCLRPGAAEPQDFAGFLNGQLPGFMMPKAYVTLERIPLTANGKLDEAALPLPKVTQPRYQEPSSELEAAMARIWSEVLGLEQVGVQDHFFELGGHSLQATRLMHRISQKFQIKLPLQTLFLKPTVSTMAEAVAEQLKREARVESNDLLVKLSDYDQDVPLFLVHPVGGHVFCYRALAESLGPEQACYGFRAVGSEGEEVPLSRIEAMAETYLTYLNRVYPHGPVYIAGWSLGGAIAFEMATRLAASGRELAQVFLIDSYLPHPGSVPESDGTKWIGFARDLGLAPEDLGSWMAAEDPYHTLAQLLRTRLPQFAQCEPSHLRQLFLLYCQNRAAYLDWSPQAGHLPVLLLHRAEYPDLAIAAWARYADLQHEQVDGDHYSMLQAPLVNGLASRIKTLMPTHKSEDLS